MSTIALLCTDFDGTLIDPFFQGQCTEEFLSRLFCHQQDGGTWVINTGRSFTYTLEGLSKFRSPVSPEYIISLEREIYRRIPSGEWKYFSEWTEAGRARHKELMLQCRESLQEIYKQALRYHGVTIVREQEAFIGLIIPEEKTMRRFILELEDICRHFPKFSFQRNTIYLRFSHADYHKGSTLAELCRLINLSREAVLAIGDSYNDLPMLGGETASMCACPANAVAAVKQAVAHAGGFVASRTFASGVVEAMDHFRSRE
ncbi:MAG: HAD-IIB family hydrolase [Candidatus Xiphinematobacter sp.]|nr:MAG: HAD-IIB family hydrolase [Candidatus Xiphinematobacter sp.]